MKVLGVSLLALAFLTSSAFANSNFGLSFNGKSNVTQGSDYGYDKNAQLNPIFAGYLTQNNKTYIS